MLNKILEVIAFLISISSLIYGIYHLLNNKVSKLFQIYVCSVSCYVLEEVWVIVDSLLGNSIDDGLLSVRLISLFGCLCFLLTANLLKDESIKIKDNSIKIISLIVPIVLTVIYYLSTKNRPTLLRPILGFLSVSPGIVGSYFCFKHILVNKKDILLPVFTLLFYISNSIYPLFNYMLSDTMIKVYDILIVIFLLLSLILCGKEKHNEY